jgi:histidyl-tRNA synthetase
VASAVHALTGLGLCNQDFAVFFSSRALLADLLGRLGIPEQHHAATFLALDKRGKVPDEEIQNILERDGLSANTIGQVLDLLQITSLDQAVSMLGRETRAVRDVRSFREFIEAYGISDRVEFDISVIRGLSYYTGIVFEAFDRGKESRAIFGGGRYDDLAADIGGKPLTGVGLGFGDVVVSDLLTAKGKLPDNLLQVDVAVGYMEDAQHCTAMQVASQLREQGRSVDLALRPEKAKAFFSRVGKGNYVNAVYVGPDDVAGGTVRVKDLATREELVLELQ